MSATVRTGFGLTFDVEPGIDLGTLRSGGDEQAAVGVVRGAVSTVDGEQLAADSFDGRRVQWVDRLPGGALRFSSVDYGAFLVPDGPAPIVCEPLEGRRGWESILVSQVLPLASTVRGFEVLHASAVVIGGGAVLFIARSGVGKTTLAAHLVALGADLLADDATALSMTEAGEVWAHAAGDRLHLDPDDARAVVDRGPEFLRIDGTRHDKQVVVARDAGVVASPVRAVCFVDRLSERAVDRELLARDPAPSPVDLLASTFNLTVRTPERLFNQLEVCSAIARLVPVFRVSIGPSDPAPAVARKLFDRLANA